MIISYSWINKYFDNKLPKPNELAEVLNFHAFEVEGADDLSKRFENIIVGEVLNVQKHPNADHLSVATVNVGDNELQIVCGASNLKKGQKVPVALVGAVLPGGFEIGKANLRGVESSGMICSETELGLAKESEGIMVLNKDAQIGQNFAEYFGLNDTILDIDVLPNRAHDCLCHRGIAKEIATLTGLKIKTPIYSSKATVDSEGGVGVKIEDENLCRRYVAVEVKNIEVKESPKWLKEKLEAIGQRSINNIVDATNYVMFDLGQPLHAFDQDKLSGNEILIRSAKIGEKITTLDKQEVELDESVLVIADSKSPLAIAGVKGGDKAEVDEKTKNLVLESANFQPTNIRKTSRRLNILTDSAKRFENDISPELASVAMGELVSLIKDVAGTSDTEFKKQKDVYPRKPNLYKVGVSVDEVNKILGIKISKKEVEDILNRFNFDFEKVNPIEKVLELAPKFVNTPYKLGASITYDAPNEFDCSSFTSYLFAQTGVGIPRISVDQYIFGKPVSEPDLRAGDLVFANTGEGKIHNKSIEFLPDTEVKEGVDHLGLYLGNGKIIHTSRFNKNGTEIGKINEFNQFKNIIGYRRMTDDQIRYVVTVPSERLDLRIKEDLIEEIGRVYGYKNIKSELPKTVNSAKVEKTFYYQNKVRNILTDLGFMEVYTYVFCDKGGVKVQKPLASNLGFLRTNLSDGIQKSLNLNEKNAPLLGLDEIKIFEIGKVFPAIDREHTSFTIGVRSIKKMKKSKLENTQKEIIQEVINVLKKEISFDLEIKSLSGGILEVNFDELVEKLPEPKNYDDVLPKEIGEAIKYQKISPYPFVLRDVAVWLPNDKSSDDLLNIIKENAGELLAKTKLFDTYAPDGENRTSYAFNLVFQSQEKTLTDEEINKIMDKITEEVEKNGWEVR